MPIFRASDMTETRRERWLRGLPLLFFSALLLGTAAGWAQNTPLLTLNKSHLPLGPQVNVGTPFTYVIEVLNGGAASSHVSVTDNLPPGFVQVGPATCAYSFAASGPPTSSPPLLGEFVMPTGGKVVITINGYFNTSGPKANIAAGSAKDNQGNPLSVGNANTSQDSVTVRPDPILADLKVEKCVMSGSSCGSTSSVSLPAHLHYKVTVTNTTSQAVYLGGLLTLKDTLSDNTSIPLAWSASGFTCTPSSAATDCPDLPPVAPLTGTLQGNSATMPFQYSATGASTGNDAGSLPGNASYTIEFDVALTTTAKCKTGPATWSNSAFLDLSSFGDQNPANNTSQPSVVTTINTNLPDCPPATPGLQMTKAQINPAGNSAAWNSPVTYRVTFNNPAGGVPLTNIPLSDSIYKVTGTPTFQATVTAGPTCVTGCSTLASPSLLSPTVSSDYTLSTLWTATLPSLNPGQQAMIEYKAK